jgi:DNA-binding NarL/FixJ family response regulator
VEPLLSDPDFFFGLDDLAEDPVRVVLGDDNGLYRRGLLTALEDENDLEVVAEAGPGADLIAAVRALAPDVVVCSLSMGNASGVETTYAITEVMPLVRVAMLTTDQDPRAKTLAAVRSGAIGEIDKVDALEEAARVIRGVHGGWPVLRPATWAGIAAQVAGWLAPGDAVDHREQAVLLAMAGGGSWSDAADAVGVRAEAARNQVRNLLARCRAAGYPDAARAALGAGLVAAP